MEATNGYFVCHICKEKFMSFVYLNSHINNDVGKVVCETCGAGFLTKYSLLGHKDTHINKRRKYNFCDSVFFQKGQLKYHIAIVHRGKTGVHLKNCSFQTFKESYSKMAHMRSKHGVVKNFLCIICKSNFGTRKSSD